MLLNSKMTKSSNSANHDNEKYWDNFYKKNNLIEESGFCRYIKSRIKSDTIIVDLGCGTGRDTHSFFKDGYSVIGVDRSSQAIYLNSDYLDYSHDNRFIQLKKVDIVEEDKFFNCLKNISNEASLLDRKILIYARFLLHSINDKTEYILLKTISNILKSGDKFAAEFRTIEDSKRKKVYDNHYRRYVNSDKLIKRLELEHGFKLEDYVKGTGLSKFKGEDPFLARILVEKV